MFLTCKCLSRSFPASPSVHRKYPGSLVSGAMAVVGLPACLPKAARRFFWGLLNGTGPQRHFVDKRGSPILSLCIPIAVSSWHTMRSSPKAFSHA